MSTLVLLTITGLGLGALYFLVASGLSLIFGLMRVLNFAHGAFLTFGAYLGWVVGSHLGGASTGHFLLVLLTGTLIGALVGAAPSSCSSGRCTAVRSIRSWSPSASA